MAKLENLEEPRDGLIKQEIISYEQSTTGQGMIMLRKVTRKYHPLIKLLQTSLQ